MPNSIVVVLDMETDMLHSEFVQENPASPVFTFCFELFFNGVQGDTFQAQKLQIDS